MAPTVERMYQAAGTVSNTRDIFSEASVKSLFDAAEKGKGTVWKFLARHSHPKDRTLFMELAARLERDGKPAPAVAQAAPPPATPAAPPAAAPPAQQAQQTPPAAQPVTPPPAPPPPPLIDKEDFRVLIPSFVTSELKNAFQIGFLIFVRLIVDMVVANILLSMGMSMLSPSVISLPFKLLLFVLVDGWYLVVRGLVLSYT